jgi:hypothetical protein
MKLPRRHFLKSAVLAAASPALSRIAWSQAYPARPVHVLVGFPGGSSQDIVARIIGEWLSQRLGQPVIIDNRPGAGGNIAVETAVNAPADGYILLMTGPNNAVNATLYDNLKFNFLRDIEPVAGIMSVPLVMEVNLSVPARSVPEVGQGGEIRGHQAGMIRCRHHHQIARHLTNSRIARSRPSCVSGYIRPPMSARIMRIDWVWSQSRSGTGLSQTEAL